MARRARTPDWAYVGWHYRALRRIGDLGHNKLVSRVRGMERIPLEGGVVLAANHSSYWDPVLLNGITPRPVCWLAKKELMTNAFNRWFFFDRGGCIPIDRSTRNPEALAAADTALRAGRLIGIFPEGTRHVGALGPPKPGVARLALRAGVPVVPVGVLSDRFWGPKQKAPNLREPIWLHVGEPMMLQGQWDNPEDARRETARVMEAIGKLLDGAREARERGERWPRG